MTANQYEVIRLTQELSRLEQISEQQIDLILQAFPASRLSEAAANFAFKILLFNKKRLLSLSNS